MVCPNHEKVIRSQFYWRKVIFKNRIKHDNHVIFCNTYPKIVVLKETDDLLTSNLSEQVEETKFPEVIGPTG